ncbi:hypothetical protein [Blastopirellula retiformator]|uniref:Uncharacterized protein n=1 Tax=Blastopirellula retiformator TaxID=2527970 RepID=A0A5C5UX61_9BACT|nr:hypothetical protein [Blastopirellula retiformator]TWT30022.1 hypothetical protein Enr8_46790 [Blastopirellula retiformator]
MVCSVRPKRTATPPAAKTNIEGDSTKFVEAIPVRYNQKSNLQLKVDADRQQQDFELTSKS